MIYTGINFLLYNLDKDFFSFVKGIGAFAFPFGFFSGMPLTVISAIAFGTDEFIDGILLFGLSILNLIATFYFADWIDTKLPKS